MISPWVAYSITALVLGAAFWKGGWEERLTAAVLLVNIILSQGLRDNSWPRIQIAELGADVAALAVFTALALRSAKYWPMAIAAFQLLAVMTHVAKVLDPTLYTWAYLSAIIIWTYLIYIALSVGTWNHWRAQRERAAGAPLRR